jgi:hypothetical protein
MIDLIGPESFTALLSLTCRVQKVVSCRTFGILCCSGRGNYHPLASKQFERSSSKSQFHFGRSSITWLRTFHQVDILVGGCMLPIVGFSLNITQLFIPDAYNIFRCDTWVCNWCLPNLLPTKTPEKSLVNSSFPFGHEGWMMTPNQTLTYRAKISKPNNPELWPLQRVHGSRVAHCGRYDLRWVCPPCFRFRILP